MRREFSEWRRWGGPAARVAACAVGVAVAAVLVVFGAVIAAVVAVALSSIRGARRDGGPVAAQAEGSTAHAGPRMRARAPQRAAADEAAR